MNFSNRTPVVIFLLAMATAVFWTIAPPKSAAQGPAMSGGGNSQTTWHAPKDAKFAGPQSCSKCHADEAGQHSTAMGRAMEPVATSAVLRSYPRLTYRSGPYAYEIVRQGEQSVYTITDGSNTFSEPIIYSFGQGKAGQTYIFRHNGSLWETRVSFYRDLKGLDWTMGYQLSLPKSLDDAAGRALGKDDVRECFGCHSTAGISGLEVKFDRLIPGVTCEACHGPGVDHIAAMEAKQFKDKRIFNPGKLEPDDLAQQFCGSCHRSAEDVLVKKLFQGIISVRFQPYRLFTSQGHDTDDARLRCTACHNPHANPVEEPTFYDPKCFACHRSSASLKSAELASAEEAQGRTDKACPVGQRLCVTCHMPKVELPGTHFSFTDHRIRIANAADPFPN
jgi:Cytochrome c554 and c-prime